MKRLMISTAIVGLAAAPAALADDPRPAEVSELPENYDTIDLNTIALEEVRDADNQTNANLDQQRLYPSETSYTPSGSQDMDGERRTIVDAAAGDERFSTLVDLVKAAGLAETLSSDGPYTVFAPTNDAFAELPAEKVDYLTSPQGREDLKSILKAHVTTGKLTASEVPSSGLEVLSVNDTQLDITSEYGDVMVEGAKVVVPNIMTDNGIIHGINAVIMPEKTDQSATRYDSTQSMPNDM